jgi:hypothetical protein
MLSSESDHSNWTEYDQENYRAPVHNVHKKLTFDELHYIH